MVALVAIRVACFVALAACAALCQQGDGQRSSKVLPDAPSVQALARVRESASGLGIRDIEDGSGVMQASLMAVYKEPVQKPSGDIFQKYLNPSAAKRNAGYRPSTSVSLIGRATGAASKIIITRDESGKGRLNTQYVLAVLTSAMAHAAYRPYWNRPVGAPLSDFGSTIGNDAGMNVLHEFAPGLEQMVKSHTPKFVTRIEERVGR